MLFRNCLYVIKLERNTKKSLKIGCLWKGRLVWFAVVWSPSRVCLFATPWIVAHQAPLSFTISQSLLKFMSTEPGVLSNHLILCRPLLLLPSVCPSVV